MNRAEARADCQKTDWRMTFLLDDGLPWKLEKSLAAFKPPETMLN